MSIQSEFSGFLGTGVWYPLDMGTFQTSTWSEGELDPLGRVSGGTSAVRQCTRSAKYGMLFFGFNSLGTTSTAVWRYIRTDIPPRNTSTTLSGSPSLELWLLGEQQRLRLTFSMSKPMLAVYSTADNWATWTSCQYDQTEAGAYIVEVPKCQSVAILTHKVNEAVSGTIKKIEIWKQ